MNKTKEGETQLVVFDLNEEEFACEIDNVREVVKMLKVTPLPESIDFVEGVINMRGEVIPVIDLRKRFSMDDGERNDKNRIIIAEVEGQMFGLVVDSVSEVAHISSQQIQEAPNHLASGRTGLIKGIGKIDDRMIIILDIKHILSTDEMTALEGISQMDTEVAGAE